MPGFRGQKSVLRINDFALSSALEQRRAAVGSDLTIIESDL
jgi:hypothetical protein